MQSQAITTDWKATLKRLKQDHIKRTAPGFYSLSGGEKMKIKPYRDDTANGLTKCIIDFITFSGGTATRISSQGQMRKINGEMKWTKGNTRKGIADIHAVHKGMHLSIEVKIGRDQLSDQQLREKDKIERAGGLYYVARNMDSFIEWFTMITAKLER